MGLSLQATYNERYNLFIGVIRALSNIVLNIILFNIFGIIGIAYSTLITYILNLILFVFFGLHRLNKGGHIH